MPRGPPTWHRHHKWPNSGQMARPGTGRALLDRAGAGKEHASTGNSSTKRAGPNPLAETHAEPATSENNAKAIPVRRSNRDASLPRQPSRSQWAQPSRGQPPLRRHTATARRSRVPAPRGATRQPALPSDGIAHRPTKVSSPSADASSGRHQEIREALATSPLPTAWPGTGSRPSASGTGAHQHRRQPSSQAAQRAPGSGLEAATSPTKTPKPATQHHATKIHSLGAVQCQQPHRDDSRGTVASDHKGANAGTNTTPEHTTQRHSPQQGQRSRSLPTTGPPSPETTGMAVDFRT